MSLGVYIMKDLALELEKGLKKGLRNAKRVDTLYELLSTYNAYTTILLNAEMELRDNVEDYCSNLDYYLEPACYEDQIDSLFSLFGNDEYLKLNDIEGTDIDDRDMIFLIDNDKLLKINTFLAENCELSGLLYTDYEIVKFKTCIGKVYTHSIYHGDPYYCESNWEDKKSFCFFDESKLIRSNYVYKRQFKKYENVDIRDVLKVQSLEDIYEKITEAKNNKVKKLTLKNNY